MTIRQKRSKTQAQPQKKLHWSWLAKQVRLPNVSFADLEVLSKGLDSLPDNTVIKVTKRQIATILAR